MSKHLCCILTDDFFLYNGIKDLYPEMTILRESLSGDILNLSCSGCITTIIIDGRVLLGGKWNGYENLIKENTDANVIWLLHRSVCGFFKCENFLPCIGSHLDFHLFRITLLERIKNTDGVIISCDLLSPYQKRLLPYFVDGISFDVLSKFFKCSEKTLHAHRLHITSKLGFRSVLHMSSIFYRISPLLVDNL